MKKDPNNLLFLQAMAACRIWCFKLSHVRIIQYKAVREPLRSSINFSLVILYADKNVVCF